MSATLDATIDLLAQLLLDPPETPGRRHGATLLIDHLLCTSRAAGTHEDLTARSAAERAALASAEDRDDVDWGLLTHPGSVVWPVVVKAAEARTLSGKQLWRAAVIGYEGTARVARLLGSEHRSRFHPTATAGTVGATLAAATVTGATSAQTATALGHGLSVMGGSIGCVRELSQTRQFHRSHAVRTGEAAAQAAASGLAATRRDLDVGGGVLGPADPADIRQLLGADWTGIDDASIRVFPTSGWNQMVYEAAAQAGAQARGEIQRITVEVPATQIATAEACDPWVNVLHAAVLGVGRDDEHERLLAAASTRATDLPGARVTLRTGAGTASSRVDSPLGHPTRPASDSDLASKWGCNAVEATARIDDVAEALADSLPGSAAQILDLISHFAIAIDTGPVSE